MVNGDDTRIGGINWSFPETSWTKILNSEDLTEEELRKRMEYLISTYWKPVYKYIRSAWNKNNEDAKDLTQEFFLRFTSKNYLKSLVPEKGRFRYYVKSALKHFLMDSKDKERAKKRGGGYVPANIDSIDESNFNDTKGPGDIFDREWVNEVIAVSMRDLKDYLTQKGKSHYYEIFEKFYFIYNASERKKLADEFNLKETDVKNHLSYTRKLLKRMMRNVISMYVYDNSEIEDELGYILSVKFE